MYNITVSRFPSSISGLYASFCMYIKQFVFSDGECHELYYNTRVESFSLSVQIQKKSEHSLSQAVVFGDV